MRAFRSGLSLTCVVDILTHNAFAPIPLLLSLSSAPSPSHAWPTPSAFSSMILPPSSPTFLSPTHSPSLTSLRAGTLASPQAARPSPVSRGTAAAFMSHPRMARRSPFSGGVRSHAVIFFHLSPSPSSVFLQETASSCPAAPRGLSPTTWSSTARQILPSRLLLWVVFYWQSMMASSPVTTPCRSSSTTPPIQHRRSSRSTMRLSPSIPHHQSAFLDDHSLLYPCALPDTSDTD